MEKNVKKRLVGNGHFIQNRKAEIAVGVALFLLGALLIYDAFDGRGKKVPWPGGAIMPW
jgi:hypothetical protein